MQVWRIPSWMDRRGIYRLRRGDGQTIGMPDDGGWRYRSDRLSRCDGRQASGNYEGRVAIGASARATGWRRGSVVLSFPSRLRGRRILWCGCMRTISDWLAMLGGGQPRPRTSTLKTDCDSGLFRSFDTGKGPKCRYAVPRQSTRCVAKEEKVELGLIVRFPRTARKRAANISKYFEYSGGNLVWQDGDWLCQCKANINLNIVLFLFAKNQQSSFYTKQSRTAHDPTLTMGCQVPIGRQLQNYVWIVRMPLQGTAVRPNI